MTKFGKAMEKVISDMKTASKDKVTSGSIIDDFNSSTAGLNLIPAERFKKERMIAKMTGMTGEQAQLYFVQEYFAFNGIAAE